MIMVMLLPHAAAIGQGCDFTVRRAVTSSPARSQSRPMFQLVIVQRLDIVAASHDQHSGGDQLVADMGGRPGVPRAGCDAGSLCEDVVATGSDLTKFGDGVGEVVLLRCMPPSRAVQRAVKKLIFGGHDSISSERSIAL